MFAKITFALAASSAVFAASVPSTAEDRHNAFAAKIQAAIVQDKLADLDVADRFDLFAFVDSAIHGVQDVAGLFSDKATFGDVIGDVKDIYEPTQARRSADKDVSGEAFVARIKDAALNDNMASLTTTDRFDLFGFVTSAVNMVKHEIDALEGKGSWWRVAGDAGSALVHGVLM